MPFYSQLLTALTLDWTVTVYLNTTYLYILEPFPEMPTSGDLKSGDFSFFPHRLQPTPTPSPRKKQ